MALSDWIDGARVLLGRAWGWVTHLFAPVAELLPSPDPVPPVPSAAAGPIIPQTSDESPVATLDGISVYRTGRVLWWRDGDLSIDYDGSPNTYAPPGVGQPLDKLANAGHPGNWWGIETDAAGEPLVQGPRDPYPGYYISTTALTWPGKSRTERYVDGSLISFLSLPPVFKELGAKLGDLAWVESSRTGRGLWAIWADVGPTTKLGEGSIHLARALGVEDSSLRDSGINVALYSGSGDGQPHPEGVIQSRGYQLPTRGIA